MMSVTAVATGLLMENGAAKRKQKSDAPKIHLPESREASLSAVARCFLSRMLTPWKYPIMTNISRQLAVRSTMAEDMP